VNKTIALMHLFPKNKKDKEAYWKGYDWDKAIAYAMEYAGLSYSGEYDFVETSYVFPTTHMVAPKDELVTCNQCHTRDKSRLANITGVYLPGRDRLGMLDTIGWLVVLGALLGVTLHGLGRIFAKGSHRYNKDKEI
jgi:hypothetical protein